MLSIIHRGSRSGPARRCSCSSPRRPMAQEHGALLPFFTISTPGPGTHDSLPSPTSSKSPRTFRPLVCVPRSCSSAARPSALFKPKSPPCKPEHPESHLPRPRNRWFMRTNHDHCSFHPTHHSVLFGSMLNRSMAIVAAQHSEGHLPPVSTGFHPSIYLYAAPYASTGRIRGHIAVSWTCDRAGKLRHADHG